MFSQDDSKSGEIVRLSNYLVHNSVYALGKNSLPKVENKF